jgi:hypothetical protein
VAETSSILAGSRTRRSAAMAASLRTHSEATAFFDHNTTTHPAEASSASIAWSNT